MIDLESVKNVFKEYVNTYDMSEEMIELKYKHSYNVMEYCVLIAESLKLSEEEVKLAGLIGLLHDIGRFEQWRVYKTFLDKKSLDHGDYSIKMLFDNNLIRKFIETNKYDEVIKKSIKYHNKYKIGECNEVELLFSKIIRDADKLDIYNILMDSYKKLEFSNEKITYKVFNDFINKKSIYGPDVIWRLDSKLVEMGFIFDFHFIKSYKIINDKDYMNILFNLIIDKLLNKDSIEKIVNAKEVAINYLEEKLRSENNA